MKNISEIYTVVDSNKKILYFLVENSDFSLLPKSCYIIAIRSLADFTANEKKYQSYDKKTMKEIWSSK